MPPHKIRKAVLPVAGLGTRMFPASKSIPKEMLTVVDRPVIDWVVAEALEAGIEQIIFVTARGKGAIEDHFDASIELEQAFARKGASAALAKLQNALPDPGSFIFIRQQRALGLGHAVWCARHAVGREPFAVLLPDVIAQSSPGCLAQMAQAYESHGGNIIAVETVPWSKVSSYGILDLKGSADKIARIHDLVEKPAPDRAPSNAAIAGRYILQPAIFDRLAAQRPGAGGEIQLTDALRGLLPDRNLWAFHYSGRIHDCGDKMGFLLANLGLALEHPELGSEFRQRALALLDNKAAQPDNVIRISSAS